jgi:pimeloyl-ACP methyl ester carboxylesterase
MADITGHYAEVQGCRTYFECSGEGVPLLLIHTAGREGRQWHDVMSLLGSEFRCFAPDLPGHGKSWPLADNTCLQDINDIADWLRDFMAVVSPGPFVVMGCSIGGNLSLLMGARFPEVKALIALQGAARTPAFSETALELMTHPQVSLMHANMDFTMSLVGRASRPEGRSFAEWCVLTLNAPAQQGDLRAYSRCDNRDIMKDIRVPALMVRGEDDWIVSQDMVDDTKSRLVNAPICELIMIPEIGHFPHLEAPERISEIARGFFKKAGVMGT